MLVRGILGLPKLALPFTSALIIKCPLGSFCVDKWRLFCSWNKNPYQLWEGFHMHPLDHIVKIFAGCYTPQFSCHLLWHLLKIVSSHFSANSSYVWPFPSGGWKTSCWGRLPHWRSHGWWLIHGCWVLLCGSTWCRDLWLSKGKIELQYFWTTRMNCPSRMEVVPLTRHGFNLAFSCSSVNTAAFVDLFSTIHPVAYIHRCVPTLVSSNWCEKKSSLFW